MLDVTNNALYALEGSIIRDALLTKDANERSKRIRQYVAVRHERVSKLPAELVEYESRNEFMEGLAHYVAYRWDQLGESVDPIPEMWYRNGFKGYKGVLGQQYLDAIKDMKPVIAVDDDRMGKKFGAGPLRWKLYEVGAAEALMLDYVYPQWKNEIFADGVYLGDLLERGVSMSNEQIADLLRTAKVDYGYEQAYKQKEAFAKEGNDKIQEKLNSIINTDGTLVHIYYGDLTSDAPRIRFTPFGVTRIEPSVAIYDTVPVGVKINDNNVLLMKNVRPVIVDKGERSITFAVPGSLDVASSPELRLDTNDLTLTVIGPVEAHRVGKELRIYLRKPQVQ